MEGNAALTLDYGVRFLWYTPWYSSQPAAVFVPERYDPAKAPRLFQPARINSVNVAFDPVNRRDAAERVRRHVRPWHRRPLQRDGQQRRPELPEGIPGQSGPRAGAALGLAWDMTGDSKTAMHASVGLYHNPHVNANGLDAMARNPPAQNTPSIIYGTMDTLLAAGRAGGVLEPAQRRLRRLARREDAEELQLLGWRPARDRLGHGARRHLRRVPDAQRRDGHQHQHGARRRALRRRQSAERESAEPDDRQAGRVPAALPRLPEHHDPLAFRHARRTTRCRCSSIAATSTACSLPSPTPSAKTISDGSS